MAKKHPRRQLPKADQVRIGTQRVPRSMFPALPSEPHRASKNRDASRHNAAPPTTPETKADGEQR
jgi:hypothetical protein